MTVANAAVLGERCSVTRYGAGTPASSPLATLSFQPGMRSTKVTEARSEPPAPRLNSTVIGPEW